MKTIVQYRQFRDRWLLVVLLTAISGGISTYHSLSGALGSTLNCIAIISLFVPIIILLVDSYHCMSSVFFSGFKHKLLLIQERFTELRLAIDRAKDYILSLPREERETETDSQVRDIESDFAAIPITEQLLIFLARRLFVNILISVLCFCLVDMNLHIFENYLNKTVNHEITKENFVSEFYMFSIKHTFAFIGKGPTNSTSSALQQTFILIETIIAFLYLLFILGSILNVIIFVSNELKPGMLREPLKEHINQETTIYTSP